MALITAGKFTVQFTAQNEEQARGVMDQIEKILDMTVKDPGRFEILRCERAYWVAADDSVEQPPYNTQGEDDEDTGNHNGMAESE